MFSVEIFYHQHVMNHLRDFSLANGRFARTLRTRGGGGGDWDSLLFFSFVFLFLSFYYICLGRQIPDLLA